MAKVSQSSVAIGVNHEVGQLDVSMEDVLVIQTLDAVELVLQVLLDLPGFHSQTSSLVVLDLKLQIVGVQLKDKVEDTLLVSDDIQKLNESVVTLEEVGMEDFFIDSLLIGVQVRRQSGGVKQGLDSHLHVQLLVVVLLDLGLGSRSDVCQEEVVVSDVSVSEVGG